MKKFKGAIALLLAAVIVSVFAACGSNSQYTDKEVTVTDENGQAVTEIVTNSNGEAVTNSNGEAVTQVVTTVVNSTTKKNEAGKSDKTTSKQTTKKPSSTKPSSNKPNDKTTSKQNATTTTEPPSAPNNEEVDKGDCVVSVILPFFSAYDTEKYELVLKVYDDKDKEIGKETWSFEGCKGQEIVIAVPKEYKGKQGVFSVNLKGKEYSVKNTIKNNLSVKFETILIIDGVDD